MGVVEHSAPAVVAAQGQWCPLRQGSAVPLGEHQGVDVVALSVFVVAAVLLGFADVAADLHALDESISRAPWTVDGRHLSGGGMSRRIGANPINTERWRGRVERWKTTTKPTNLASQAAPLYRSLVRRTEIRGRPMHEKADQVGTHV